VSAKTALYQAISSRSTPTQDTTATNNMASIDWEQALWPAYCGKCNAKFDVIVNDHLSLCGTCNQEFADCAFCAVNYARLANGTSPPVCDDCRQVVNADCDSCGGYFDRFADNHPSRCGVCQVFPADSTTIAPAGLTTPQAAAPPLPAQEAAQRPERGHYKDCALCSRSFPPNKNNTGVHCTPCCNKEASQGNDLFTPFNLPLPRKVAENLNNARAPQQQAAPASGISVAAAARAMLTY
jgi:hypothetical protein